MKYLHRIEEKSRPGCSRRRFFAVAAAIGTGCLCQPSQLDQLLALLSGRRDSIQPLCGESATVESLLRRTWKEPLSGPSSSQSVYLTFDDGPLPCSSRIMDALDRTRHKVTFFVIGRNLANAELRKIAVRAIQAGHEIANHSYSHPAFSSISAKQAEKEIRSTHELIQDVIAEAGGDPVTQDRFFRFPYGALASGSANEVCNRTLAALDYQIAWWNVDTNDWQMELWWNPRPFSRVLASLKCARVQDVVLMHDRVSTARHVEDMLGCVQSLGLASVPLSRYRRT